MPRKRGRYTPRDVGTPCWCGVRPALYIPRWEGVFCHACQRFGHEFDARHKERREAIRQILRESRKGS